MDSTKKFQEAFDILLNDFNAKVDEVKSNLNHLTTDVKVQVEGQKENLQEYGEKIKGRINQIVDVDKVRESLLAEAENVIDETKSRIEKIFQFINETVNQGEKKASDGASEFTKKAEAATANLGKNVRKVSRELKKDIQKATGAVEKKINKVSKNVATASKNARSSAKKAATAVKGKAAQAEKNVRLTAQKANAAVKKTKSAAKPVKKAPAKPAKKATAVKKKKSK